MQADPRASSRQVHTVMLSDGRRTFCAETRKSIVSGRMISCANNFILTNYIAYRWGI
jgi:hypothetical protein